MNAHRIGPRARSLARGVLIGAAAATAVWLAGAAERAAAAPAGSIAYVKDGDVHLTSPDGARTHRVTTTGGYSEVSQADDGTLAALAGERIHTLTPQGKLLADIATPVSDGLTPPADPNADFFTGPYAVRISPDATRIAYTYFWRHFTFDPTCRPPAGCFRTRLESGTGITWANRLTPWEEFGGPLTGWKWASWIDDERLVRGDAGVVLAENLVVNRIAPGLGDDDLLRWVPHNYDIVGDPVISRTGTHLATTTKNWTSLTWRIEVSRLGPLPQQPTYCFRIEPADTTGLGTPQFSPDGTTLAWAEKDGIHVMPLPADCPAAPVTQTRLLVPGASSPSWGPAPVPAGAGPAPAPAAGPGAPPRAVVRSTVTRAALGRRGARVRVRVAGPGRVAVTVRIGARLVARGATTARAAGVVAVPLRVVAPARVLRTAGRLRVAAVLTPPAATR